MHPMRQNLKAMTQTQTDPVRILFNIKRNQVSYIRLQTTKKTTKQPGGKSKVD